MTNKFFEEIVECINYVGYVNKLSEEKNNLEGLNRDLELTENILLEAKDDEASKDTRKLIEAHRERVIADIKSCNASMELIQLKINAILENVKEDVDLK